ncbi:MAG: substrate-binding domain-containing protein [Phycisphaerae bacterium]
MWIALLTEAHLHYSRRISLAAATYLRSLEERPKIAMIPSGHLCNPGWLDRVGSWAGAMGYARQDDLAFAAEEGIPMISCATSAGADVARVLPDHRAIGRLAGQHLLEMGHRRVGFVNYPAVRIWQDRQEGLRETIEAAGGTVSPIPWSGDATDELREQLVGFTAAMTPTDCDAERLIDVAMELGLRVPQDLAVIGVDNDAFLCEMAEVPLTSVDPGPDAIGLAAAETLWEALQGGSTPPMTVQHMEPRGLAVRLSTDHLAHEDDCLRRALQFIRDHGCEEITVDSIMQDMDISRRTLEVRFKKALGRTPLQEIHRVRFERAKRLLTETSLRITDIAHRCGYPDHCRFSTEFRRHVGMPPSDFRRNHTSIS